MSYSSNPHLTTYSRKLRKEMTKEERHLWYDFLKLLDIPFHRQKPLDNTLWTSTVIGQNSLLSLTAPSTLRLPALHKISNGI